MLEINEEITVPAPPDEVWKVLCDPAEVVSCIQGAELGDEHDDGSFDGTLMVKFSAIRVRFGARVTLDLDESERQGRLSARGRDAQGATRYDAHAAFRVVEESAAGVTVVHLTGEVHLAGRLASVIEAGAGAVVARMTRDFTDKLARRLSLEPAGAAEPVSVPAAGPAPTAVPVPAPGSVVGPAELSRPRVTAPERRPRWARLRVWWRRAMQRARQRAGQRRRTVRPRRDEQSGVAPWHD